MRFTPMDARADCVDPDGVDPDGRQPESPLKVQLTPSGPELKRCPRRQVL